jgi:hypothetical protein
MKKYIYSAIILAAVAACVIFFFGPPEVTNQANATEIALTFRFPEGYEFTADAPFVLTWRGESPEGILSVPVADKNFNPLISPYKLLATPALGSRAVVLNARLYYCHKTSRMCFQDDFETRVPLDPQGTSRVSWAWDISPKKT